MASQPPEESRVFSLDQTDSGYTDAASALVSEPGYVDASSAPVSGDKLEADGDVSTSSNTGTLNSASSESQDDPYRDAYSEDSLFYDAQEVQSLKDSPDQPAMSAVTQQPPVNGNRNQYQDDKRVYFELEKQEDIGEDTEKNTLQNSGVNLKGQTLARANVNVAARARLFEGAKTETKDGEQDVMYDVPPPKSDQSESVASKRSATSPRRTDIYEISFVGEHSQGKADVQGSLEGSGIYEVVGGSLPPRTSPSKPDDSEMEEGVVVCSTRPKPKPAPPSPSSPTGLNNSGGFLQCKQGTPRQDPVQVFLPSHNEIENEYNKLQFSRNAEPKSTPQEAGYNSLDRHRGSPRDPTTNEPIYDCAENIGNRHSWTSEEWSDGSWGSSEFEEEENEEGYMAEPEFPAPTKPLPRKPRHSDADSVQKLPALLNKFKPRQAAVYEDIDAVCLPVTINTSKHPPPELPPPPSGLSDSERKRRCVVELTISSERSYIESLERILKEYEKPILEAITNPKASVRAVFRESREILNHHKMFQIQLSDTTKSWDEHGMIGDIFTASFSKSMLVDAYSNYVNNFAAGMDEIRTVQQNRPSFEEFLKLKEKSSYDRLSIFGLMVKPIQRFPQFIMLLQDLIKYTSHSHADRRPLQLALTELENVTHKLNERKRLSEQYFQAKQTMQLLPRQLPSQVLSSRNMEKPRRLIRFDNFDQIDGEMENMKSSNRRLILMDDMLVCVKVGLKDQDGFMMERYRLKWAVRLCDVELKDTAMTPDMQNVVKMDPKRLNMLASQLEKPAEDPFHLYADLRDMLHDLTVFGNITNLMQTLRRNYQGYNMSEELFHEVTADLQRMIQIKDEQLKLVNSCSIILVDNSKTDKPHYVMQTPTAAVKNEWCVDFNMAKLALEKQNRPGWDRSPLTGDDELGPAPALFMRSVAVDVPRHFTKVKCAIPVFMPTIPQASGVGIQHLWVCSSTSSRGQVSIVSLHNTRPALTESFKACDCDLLCSEVVTGCGQVTNVNKYLFSEDTVWMSNTHNEIVIFPLSSGGGSTATRDPLAVVRVPGKVTSIKFVDERLFCGLDDGAVLVYSRNDVGEWCIKAGRTLQLGRSPVRSQLVVEDDLWIACGHKVFVIEIDSLKILAEHTLSGHNETAILQMVRSGVGVWVAFHNSGAVRLFHAETMENLQEMSVTNTVNRVLAEKSGVPETRECVVSCLAASTGLLWIGTNVGLIVTLPLPRLSDGVPLYSGRPSVAYHAHRGPVRFIIPIYCSSSITELHRSSSLRSQLRARPSIRNRKREQIEIEGLAEDKLLSSGTELEASHPPYPQQRRDELTTSLQSNAGVPERMKDPVMKSQAGRKFFSLKRGRKLYQQTSSLRRGPATSSASRRKQSRTLSFRSELANRIKRTTLGRFQAQSMFDLRAEDPLEVEMLYENLLDDGDISQNDLFEESMDDLSVRSDSGPWSSVDDVRGSVSSLHAGNSKKVEPLDLAGLSIEDGKPKGKAPASRALSTPSCLEESTENSAANSTSKAKPKPENPLPLPPRSRPQSEYPDPPPSPRISTIRAHTMRKTSTSNAVMVLSGGDGYWDMHMGGNFSKNEDACLLFWIYKF